MKNIFQNIFEKIVLFHVHKINNKYWKLFFYSLKHKIYYLEQQGFYNKPVISRYKVQDAILVVLTYLHIIWLMRVFYLHFKIISFRYILRLWHVSQYFLYAAIKASKENTKVVAEMAHSKNWQHILPLNIPITYERHYP